MKDSEVEAVATAMSDAAYSADADLRNARRNGQVLVAFDAIAEARTWRAAEAMLRAVIDQARAKEK